MNTHATAVVGLQWGDEGKGKIVDLLTSRHDVIVRYNGGANAGHSVQVGSERYALHLVPSGILHPDKICVIGNGVVVDPEKLLQEIDGLRQRGIEVGSNLLISDRAHVVMPYHKEQDAALEDFMAGITRDDAGSLAIGTTRRGIGPAYGDKVDRSTAIRMGDLLDAAYLRERLHVICGLRTRELKALGVQAPPLDPDALAKRFGEAGERLRPHITDTVYGLHDAVKAIPDEITTLGGRLANVQHDLGGTAGQARTVLISHSRATFDTVRGESLVSLRSAVLKHEADLPDAFYLLVAQVGQ